jgi:OPT family oligopeptide transporter
MSQESIVEQTSGYTRIPSEDTDIQKESVLAQPLLGEVPAEVGKVLPTGVLEEEREVDIDDDRIKDKGELTGRAVIVRGLLGSLVAAMNVNFGLRTGWCQGGSIFAAIMSIGIFKILNPVNAFTKYEAVIATTTASACGIMTSAAGLVSSMPALKMLGTTYSVLEHYLWAVSVAFFGLYFAAIIRNSMIVKEKLRFPTGTAAAETIKAMFAQGSDTVTKAKTLIYSGLISAVFSLVSFFLPFFQQPPVPKVLADWGFRIYLNPLLLGGGMLSGLRSTMSLLAGAIVGWGILGPVARANNWTTKPDIMSFAGPRGWILWVGVAIMTADSMIQLIWTLQYAWPLIKGVYNYIMKCIRPHAKHGADFELGHQQVDITIPRQSIPWWWVVLGLTISTAILLPVGHFVFELKYYFIILAIPLSFLLSTIAARSAGETDINPVGSMGKVTQLVYAGVAPGEMKTNLLSAAVVAAGASQCGDTMQDFKNGYIVRVTPKNQFIAHALGIMFGIIVSVPVYKLYDMAFVIGGEEVPAPAAHAWRAVAEVLSQGFSALPLHVPWAILAGAIAGALNAIIFRVIKVCKPGYEVFIPSALAFGIGFIVPAKQAITMFAGALIHAIWKRVSKNTEERYFFTISSGLIAGEGIMGIVIAVLKLIGLKPLVAI